ncbi:MAG: PaaI family thioesterase [Caulobacteraceae bacterium]|nr:PaaI family thioesterase [Caulobacter sp.]
MDMTAEIGLHLSGLEQLRTLLAAGKRAGIGRALDFEAVAFEPGFAAFEGVPGLHAYNPIGMVHGGYAATLLDSACGCAVQTRLEPGWRYTTLEIKIAYHRAVTAETGKVRAEGRVLTMGRRAAFSEATLKDGEGRLLASATSSLLVMAPAPNQASAT